MSLLRISVGSRLFHSRDPATEKLLSPLFSRLPSVCQRLVIGSAFIKATQDNLSEVCRTLCRICRVQICD